MSIIKYIGSLFSGGQTRTKGTQLANPGSYSSSSAKPVTPELSLQLSAVWSCVRLITEAIGSMPINIYKVDDQGIRTKDKKHALARLLNSKCNRWQTRQEFIESIVYQYALLGNSFSLKQYNGNGDIIGLVPLMTGQMEVILRDDGEILYKYTDGNISKVYVSKDIWHNKLFGNGIVGLSPLGHARNAIGVGLAAEDSVGKVYKNGGKPSGVLMVDKPLTKEQRDKIKDNFSELAEGNNDRLFVLEANMKFEKVSLSPQDIELLASRRFQLEDICRFFAVPSILVNDSSTSTAWGSGIQQIINAFYKFGLRPYLERMEASIKCNLLKPEEWQDYEVEFDFTSLLKPDFYDRLKAGKEGVTGGLISPNEFRLSEGWLMKEGGDSLYMQQQMTPIEKLATLQRGTTKDAQQN